MGLLDTFQEENSKSHQSDDSYFKEEKSREIKRESPLTFKVLLLMFTIVCGNIASGWTTLWGIEKLINDLNISILMTITVQGVMTATALIVTSKKIEYKKSFLALYIVPMIISIGFNYVYFYSKFNDVSASLSEEHNKAIELEEKKNKLKNYITYLNEKINNGYLVKEEKLSMEVLKYTKVTTKELTPYGTGGSGEGPEYLEANANKIYFQEKLVSLDLMKKKSDDNITDILNGFVEANSTNKLKVIYTQVSQYQNLFLHFLSHEKINTLPNIFEKEVLDKGENHTVYNAILALFNPGLFEMIAIFMAIIMDFIIFIWVLISLNSNLSFKDLTDG